MKVVLVPVSDHVRPVGHRRRPGAPPDPRVVPPRTHLVPLPAGLNQLAKINAIPPEVCRFRAYPSRIMGMDTTITCPPWCEVDHSDAGPGPGVRHRSAARVAEGKGSQVLIHIEQFEVGEAEDRDPPAVFMDTAASSAGLAGWRELTADQANAIAEYLQRAASRLRQRT